MQFNISHKAMLFLLCAILVACNKEVASYVKEPGERTPVILTVGVDSEQQSTKAVITDGVGKTMNNFGANTKIFMVMKSEYGTADYGGSHDTKYTVTRGDVTANSNVVSFDSFNQRYWDDAHARSSQLSIWAYAQSGTPDYDGWKKCTFEVPNDEWDHTDPSTEYRDQTYYTSGVTNLWVNEVAEHDKGAIYPCIMTWNVTHNDDKSQNEKSVQYQDLMFSNNIANYIGNQKVPEASKKDKRLSFNFETRKFPVSTDKWDDGSLKTCMLFYHALSKITIHLRKGEGFTDGQFIFATGKNFKLKGFNTIGTFNIKDGEFQKVDTYEVPKIYQHTTPDSGDAYTLEALVIPNINDFLSQHGRSDENSRFTSDGANDMMVFVIDGVEYKLASKQLYNALHGKEGATEKTTGIIPLEPGKNYHFTFTLSKSGIVQFDASIIDWTTVTTANQTPSNARINLKLEERGDDLTDGTVLAVYRSDESTSAYNWLSGYVGNTNTLTKTSGSWGLANEWFWPDNKTYYHFRTIKPKEETVKNDASAKVDYVELSSAAFGSYKDVCWGAPMLDDADDEVPGSFKWTYSFENGFSEINAALSDKNQIYPGIGATNSVLKFTLFHAMSQINVRLTTSNDASAVQLSKPSADPAVTTYATVELLNYKDGRLLLGNGKIETTGDMKNSVVGKKTEAVFEYPYEVVPQILDNVQLRITTPDDNVFTVKLKDAIADKGASESNLTSNNISNPYQEVSTGKYKISAWYPGFSYDYTINLTLKGVDRIGVKLVDWENIVMDEGGIQIK